MVSPERNMYSNKESAKVNSGLYFSRITLADSPNVPQLGAMITEMDLSLLIDSSVAPEPKPTNTELARRLLRPPPHAFLYGILSIQWVIGVVGMDGFELRDSDERYVLAQCSMLRTHGKALGLPVAYSEWLCGNDEEFTSSDQVLCLMPKFFQRHEK